MKAFLIFFFIFATQFTYAFERCSTNSIDPTQKFLIDIKTGIFSLNANQFLSTSGFKTQIIPVIIHTIGKEIDEDILDEQINVLNSAYALIGFRFTLSSINFVNSNKWSNASPTNFSERDMKTTLYQGDSGTLNIYIQPSLGFLLGWAAFPWDYANDPKMDGIVLSAETLPGYHKNPNYPYNEGMTLTHEVGHWLGLFHTFQNGCNGDGDFIDDTAAQQSPSSGCPVAQDSCPSEPGLDDPTNFMDYSDDACLTHFTQGQITRMRASFNTYRTIRGFN